MDKNSSVIHNGPCLIFKTLLALLTKQRDLDLNLKAVDLEINPLLVLRNILRTRRTNASRQTIPKYSILKNLAIKGSFGKPELPEGR